MDFITGKDVYERLIGMECVYISHTYKEYKAKIIDIPENPHHVSCLWPTVTLEFRDLRGKLIKKNRVTPAYRQVGELLFNSKLMSYVINEMVIKDN